MHRHVLPVPHLEIETDRLLEGAVIEDVKANDGMKASV
jgi:hypothetical protein